MKRKTNPFHKQCETEIRALWEKVITDGHSTPPLPARLEKHLDLLLIEQPNGSKSFRYALLTQSLAVYVNPDLDIFALQAHGQCSSKDFKSFDARSLCKNVIVPLEREIWSSVLGASADPYVSKPLRKECIRRDDSSIKNRDAWEALFALLEFVRNGGISEKRKQRAEIVLTNALQRIKQLLEIVLHPPADISEWDISIAKMINAVSRFSQESALGARPQYTVYAILKAIDAVTHLYGTLRLAKATEADVAQDRGGDIEIYDIDQRHKLTIAVTHILTFEKLQEEIAKAKKHGISDLLILATEVKVDSTENLDISSINVKWMSINEYLRVMLMTIDADLAVQFIFAMYDVLHEFAEMTSLRRWHQLVLSLAK